MEENKHLEVASEIVEKVLPDYFQFRLWQSEIMESGNFIKEYAEKPEEIHKRLVKVLEKAYKTEE